MYVEVFESVCEGNFDLPMFFFLPFLIENHDRYDIHADAKCNTNWDI